MAVVSSVVSPDGPTPFCSICSKPVQTGFIRTETGQIFHIVCRTRQLHVRTLEQIDRGNAARNRAARLVEASTAWPHTKTQATCPLCRHPATVIDWRPKTTWIVVEDCPCDGFSIWGPIFERLRMLPVRDRHDLAHRVRAFRARHEAWITTTDMTPTGPVVVCTQRPDRSSEGSHAPDAP